MKSVLLIILFTVATTLAESDTYTFSFGSSTKECVKCQPGSYVDKDCEAGDPESTVCRRCPPGRFAPEWNNKRMCKQCKSHCYGKNQIKIANCNPYQDIVCGCPRGYWHEKHWTSDGKCIPLLQCGKGYGVDKPGSNISDVTCTECIERVNFSPVSSPFETCRPCRNCTKEGWKETKACTVMSNAECDIPTSTSTTTDMTEPTTSLTLGNITDDDKKSKNGTDKPSVVSPVVAGVVAFVFLVVVVAVVVKYRRPIKDGITRFFQYCNQDLRQYRPTDNANNDANAVVISVEGQSVQSSTTDNPYLVRRSYSNIELKPDKVLENDVFPWLAGNLGEDFLKTTYMFLPGKKLTITDVEHACHLHQNPPILAAKIDAIFRKWRDKNIENKTDKQLFIDICKTLSQRGPDAAAIVEQMKTDFAQNVNEISL